MFVLLLNVIWSGPPTKLISTWLCSVASAGSSKAAHFHSKTFNSEMKQQITILCCFWIKTLSSCLRSGHPAAPQIPKDQSQFSLAGRYFLGWKQGTLWWWPWSGCPLWSSYLVQPLQGIELRYVGQRCLILNLALDSLMSEGISFFLSFRSRMGFTSTFKLSTASYWSFRISIAFSRLSIDLSQNASVLVAPALRRCRAYKEMCDWFKSQTAWPVWHQ